MIVDSSAIVAIFLAEPGWEKLETALADAAAPKISAMAKLETSIALTFRMGSSARAELAEFLRRYRIEVVPLDDELSDMAFDAFERFGKGRHPAGLNFGDCASYALARRSGEALLFKGDGCARTDITPAL